MAKYIISLTIPGELTQDDRVVLHWGIRHLVGISDKNRVRLGEESMFIPVIDGEGGENHVCTVVEVTSPTSMYDETLVKDVHDRLRTKIPTPPSVGIETTVSKDGESILELLD
jgi:hypothetical protein